MWRSYGLLHRIPAPDIAEPDTQYDGDGATFVPAESDSISGGRTLTLPTEDDVNSDNTRISHPPTTSQDDQPGSSVHYLDPPLRTRP